MGILIRAGVTQKGHPTVSVSGSKPASKSPYNKWLHLFCLHFFIDTTVNMVKMHATRPPRLYMYAHPGGYFFVFPGGS